MPRGKSRTGTGILQRAKLQSRRVESQLNADLFKYFAIGRDQVSHGVALPGVAMEPEPARHRVLQPGSPAGKLPPRHAIGVVAGAY